jgi:predicted deacylase
LKPNQSIEEKLAKILHKISEEADYIVDIHTTGFRSINHLFTFEGMSETFNYLDSKLHIIQKGSYFGCCFDESHVLPFLNNPDKNTQEPPFACTWEVFNHSFIEDEEIEKQTQNLWKWLKSIWNNSPTNSKTKTDAIIVNETQADHLFSSFAGYFTWKKNPGDLIKKGEVYIESYNPKTNQFKEITADFDFYLIGIYGASAVAEGASIAWIAKL